MSNFRVIYDNAADRAVLSVSSAASASLGAANLVTDFKGEVWRSVGTSATITAEWAQGQFLGGVMLPYANLTAEATVRVKVYTLPGDTAPVYDSGAVLACPSVPLDVFAWGTEVLGVNAYSYGGVSCGRLWFPHVVGRKVEILLSDPTNTAGYVEIGRLVCGRYWEGAKNADYNPQLLPVDTGNNMRNDAGDLQSDNGTRHRKLTLSLSNLTAAERKTVWDLLSVNGKSRPMFFSLFPDHEDTALEQTYQMYCKLNPGAVAIPSFRQYTTSLELEEV